MKINSKIIFLLLTFLFACSNKDTVTITSISPDGKVKKQSNITIEFSKELAPPEVIDQWLSDDLIKFNPEIKGKFKWIDSRTLVNSPSARAEAKRVVSSGVLLSVPSVCSTVRSWSVHTERIRATQTPFLIGISSFCRDRKPLMTSAAEASRYQIKCDIGKRYAC